MKVILLERVEKLGQMGDVVTVKNGFARNFLLPQGKAERATSSALEAFESRRAQLEAQNLKLKAEAEDLAGRMNEVSVVLIRQSSDSGQLYGSVNTRDIATAVTEAGFTIDRKQVELGRPIKTLGLHEVLVRLHPEVTLTVEANVARSEDEAAAQARGVDVLNTEDDDDDVLDIEEAEELFEEGAATAEELVEAITGQKMEELDPSESDQPEV
ncbi:MULTISPECIES: 50S ribosomal protein L9 [unclassified Minwuia]|jgi:large subunit ribosomal protein L9|uniref:50S ribosomal protein L9 n=1 Tax=unclassified Minwuia TaxID=2618799 RepID=UPI00247854E2|nr:MULTISPECIES: 50S ribosomal protein L9 [unclassified Minwuia]